MRWLQESAGRTVRAIGFASVTPDEELVRRFPQEVARRFHLLPIAESRGRVTVAMADANDQEARSMVMELYGDRAFIVQGDKAVIDGLIRDFWPHVGQANPRILAISSEGTQETNFHAYVSGLAGMLLAEVRFLQLAPGHTRWDRLPTLRDGGWDLLLYSPPSDADARPLPVPRGLYRYVRGCGASLLLVREPRWPICRILHLLGCGASDLEALKWIRRLSIPGETIVVALTILPPVPEMYTGLRRMEADIRQVLSTNNALGLHLRKVAAQFEGWHMQANLKIRQGAPDVAIDSELERGDYDLLVVGGRECCALKGYLIPDLADKAIEIARLPVLLAGSQPGERNLGRNEGPRNPDR
jgi:nucleotide-binding universal stress UspA family protein